MQLSVKEGDKACKFNSDKERTSSKATIIFLNNPELRRNRRNSICHEEEAAFNSKWFNVLIKRYL